MKPIKCISTGFLSGILLMSNIGVHAESVDSSWETDISAHQIIIDQAVNNTTDTIISITDSIEINAKPDIVEYVNDEGYVDSTQPVGSYVEQPVDNIITYDEFMKMFVELQTEPVQETIDQTTAARTDYDAALATYNEALAQYDAAQQALTAAGLPVTIIELEEDEEGNIIEVEKEVIPDTSVEQAALESASINLINAQTNLDAASEALNNVQPTDSNIVFEEELIPDSKETIIEEQPETVEIEQEVVEQTETTLADKVTGTTSDGFQYESTDGINAVITGYTATVTDLVIPETVDGYTVTNIGEYAFSGRSEIQSISFPSTLITIQGSAFKDCTGLTNVVLPEGLKYISAANWNTEGAFQGCSNLVSVSIPTTLETANIPFKGCTNLIRIEFPEGMTSIPNSIFSGSSYLQEVILPSTLIEIKDYAFRECTGLKSINLPSGLVKIGVDSFRGCSGLTSIVFPDGLTTLGSGSFSNCTNLSSVSIPVSLTSASRVFNGCTKLTRVVLPEGMVTTPGEMFKENTCVKEVVFPSTITTIGVGSFTKCTGLESIDLPSGITEIKDYAFSECTGLKSINLPSGLINTGISSFWGCTGLTSVVLPEGLITLGSGTFVKCTNLSSVSIPVSLQNAEKAFTGCTKLTQIVFPEGMTFIPTSMFASNTCIQEVVFPSTLTEIRNYAFSGCTGIKSVNLPNGLTKIGIDGFRGCTGLTSIVLPEGLTTLGTASFSNCTNLTSVDIPVSLTSAEKAFTGCKQLTRIVFPEGMTNTPVNMFNGNTSIREVVLPSTVTTIGQGTFAGCTSLEFIELPTGLTQLSAYAFNGCTSIKSISLPSTLIKIGGAAFRNCTGLTSIILPEGLTTLELANWNTEGAFQDCKNLQNVFCPVSLNTIPGISFKNVNNLTLISEYNCYATMFAIKNDISFKVLKGYKDDDSFALDRNASSVKVYYDGMSVNGYIPVTVSYKIKDSWKDKVSSLKLDIYLPSNVQLHEDTIKLSEVYVENYTLNNRNLVIPVSKQEDTLTFLMKVKEQGRLLGYFSLSMNKENTSTYEVIDLVNEETRNFLTLNAPDVINSGSLNLNGLAPASSEVSVYVNNELNTTVRASKSGEWNAALTIEPQNAYERFMLKASVNDTDFVEKKVIYSADQPIVTKFTMSYKEHELNRVIDLLEFSGVRPTIYFLPGTEFVFDLTFDKPEMIDKVYVTSVRNNVKKYLEAVYNSASGTFKTSGFFDPNNSNYIPGKISYEYTLKQKEHVVDPDIDVDSFKNTDAFDDKVSVVVDSDEELLAELDLSQFTEDGSKSKLTYDYKVYNSINAPELLASEFGHMLVDDNVPLTKYVLPGKDGKNYLVTIDYSDPTTYLMLIHDITNDKVFGLIIDYLAENGSSIAWQQASEVVSGVGDITDLLYQYVQVTQEAEDLREEVMSSDNYSTQEERDKALRLVDEYEFDKKAFILITVGAPIVLGLSVGACAMTAPAVVLAGIIVLITVTAALFWAYRIAQIRGEEYNVRFMIDPSGYVYDIDTKERLENVTTTAYWIEYDESEGFWDNVPADTEYGILWDGSEYNIQNPMLSNIDGKYGWDVPEGWWRVKYEKEGYKTTWSNWMPVPPIQTEVNIGMKSTALPFTDVPKDAWYYSVAKECYETGLINGTSATTFSPMQTMTRAMVVTILWRMEGQPKVDFNNKFSDVSSKQWYATSVSWAEKAGVVHGYGDGTFKPDAAVTREQVAVMLANYAQYKGVYVPGTKKLNTYPDGYQVSTWAQAGMKWALTNGIISGNGAGYLNPKKSATRAEGAAMLLRMKNWL